jgi:hypothetical protein
MENTNTDLLSEIREDMKNAKKRKRVKKEVVVKSRHIKAKLAFALIIVVLMVTGVAYALERYADWRAGHQYQMPVVFREFYKDIERAGTATAEERALTDVELIGQYRLAPVIKTVYFLESTSGKNDKCRDEGKFNGFGYAQNKSVWKCYDTFKDVADRVNEWFEDRLGENGNNLVEAACFYNKGIPYMQVCDYSENFMSVLADNF